MRCYYDLHIHSCLSPCGDDDMTPYNIANMAKLKGLDIIAVTDHNSCKNAQAVIEAGSEIGLTVLPGMELTTSEDVHILVLLPDISSAEAFDVHVSKRRMRIKNRTEIYGRQLIMNARDDIVGEESDLLLAATDIGVYETVALARAYGGAALPAHIDRESNGLVSVLGALEKDMGFVTAEFSSAADDGFVRKYIDLGYNTVHDSDAHRLEDINEGDGKNFLELDEPTAAAVIAALRKGVKGKRR